MKCLCWPLGTRLFVIGRLVRVGMKWATPGEVNIRPPPPDDTETTPKQCCPAVPLFHVLN